MIKTTKRIVCLALATLLSMSALSGCSGGTASASAPAESVSGSAASGSSAAEGVKKVYLYSWSSAEAGATLVNGFNEKYAGKYEMVYVKIADAKTETINTALASGERIDVMMQSAPVDQNFRAKAGNYMPLKQFLDADGIDYADFWGPSLEATGNFQGDYYGLPYNKNVLVTYINKKLFDKAGIPYPTDDWTWEDFREIAKKLTTGEGATKTYGAMFDYVGEDFGWDFIARQKLGALYNYAPDFASTTYDKPEMMESLQFVYDMAMEDKTLMPLDEYKTLKLDADQNGMNALYSDRFAMWISPVYSAGYMKPSYGDLPEGTDIGMCNMPRPVDSTEPTTLVFTSTASIPMGVEDPQASWAALRYLCIDAPEYWAGAKTMHPGFAFASDTDKHAFNELILGANSGIPGLDSQMAITLLDKTIKEVSKDNPILQGQSKIKDLQTAELTLLFNGEQTVAQCLENLKKKGDAYIAEDIASGLKS